jgi:hydrogenase expression/formation protein HypD
MAMRYLDEYRDEAAVRRGAAAIARAATRPWVVMEVCGGQTHSIVKYGLDALLPASITLVHGPGCPVCVTPIDIIDQAIELALMRNAIVCSFGDMLRVPGTHQDLLAAKAAGGDVRIVYSPLDALSIARAHPAREVVFFAVGFETTAPATALAVHQAQREDITNFSVLVAHVRVPPAMEAILASPDNRVQGFLAPGHVCTITGIAEYQPIARRHRVPIVITGFEPVDILQGVLACVLQLEAGSATVENHYARAVRVQGNPTAQQLVREVFRVVARTWRGIGELPESGLALQERYAAFDAAAKFALVSTPAQATECRAGLVLQGRIKPHECPAFGVRCTPERPLGAPMVSSEGACAAYFRYRQDTV